ncbi:hypothetical protein UFOVP336_63 [uncultured Caudovirales phage]|jgi:hypothetical protein|uniref:Uncharacterized protein n=1 Tax=uncultured Caudovirales phage TaxID=2100421 RepID=A0A6J5LYW5_9CAUD|nr:hypothetical protein UFOVP336_63 [uncultured Caudovirales phage]
MKSCLLKHKPKDSTSEEFQKSWNNIGYTLQALRGAIEEQIKNNNSITAGDFDCPNHYAKLAYQAGENKGLIFVLSLLPETSKVNS